MPMPDLPPRLFHLGITSSGPDERTPAENRWVSYQPYLLSKGYELRPRYRQDWVPSWNAIGQSSYGCEDRGDTLALNVLDATRVEDGRRVAIKLLLPSPDDRDGVEELEILQRFSSEPFRSDPTNHTVRGWALNGPEFAGFWQKFPHQNRVPEPAPAPASPEIAGCG
ncbi:hypothetical protein BDV93DRAFT_549204 [Ceratobasidium sp. AG-I]|nr:hypothetical protein BDV93DRAFT_549204 [Ceratobasidium sp. AG-I]